MAKYRNQLPQLNGDMFLTDGGPETTFIYHDGFDLPEFAAFVLLSCENGRATVRRYFENYAAIAREHKVGFVLESVTWRASSVWGDKLGYTAEELAQVNHDAIELLVDVRDRFETEYSPMVISGCIGSHGDGYTIDAVLTPEEAEAYHLPQIKTLSETAADMITAMTVTYPEEGIGMTYAAQAVGMPIVLSFTVETDGKLPNGQTLQSAIGQIDEATNNGPVYYMINCAHPSHFEDVLASGAEWIQRLRGLRANASDKSHAELDAMEELDAGNPVELGQQYAELRQHLPHINVLGGCCGTDHRHVGEICVACLEHSH